MSCRDLSNDTRMQTPRHPRGLCTVCQKIDFVSLTSKGCTASGDGRHLHIGKLRDIARERDCPGCRLILSAAKSTGLSREYLDEATITIQPQFFETYFPDPDGNEPRTWVDENNIERQVFNLPHMERFVEVFLDCEYSGFEGPIHPGVIGAIIRIEETGPADLCGLKTTISELEGPVFRGRVVLPEVEISLIKQWMQACNVHHDICSLRALATVREQSIRLIDVHDLRIISATLAEKYVALSYVWGPTTAPFLTNDTISQCFSIGGLKDSTTPRTILDAIQLVKCIGMRYLWVDSLCIVQDDDHDKRQQLGIMDSIYISAELLLVAAAGSDANAGLPGIGGTPRHISQRIEEITGTQFITAQPSLQQVLSKSVWNHRGWTFQEAVLSRRAIVFTESLVYWSCQVDTCREDIVSKSPDTRLLLNNTNSLWPHQFGKSGTRILPQGGDRSPTTYDTDPRPHPFRSFRMKSCRTASYCYLAEAFSKRALREEKDVVWAFIGILRLQTAHFRKGFIWALPYEALDTLLLWSEISGCVYVHSRQVCHAVIRKTRRYDLKFPSWSWLSTNRPIEFMDTCDPCGTSIVSEVTWHTPLKFVDETSTTYLKSISSENHGNEHEEKLTSDLLAGFTAKQDVMDYGLLHFTAQTAVLTLRREEERSSNHDTGRAVIGGGDEADEYQRKSGREYWVKATLRSPQEKQMATITVPSQVFNEKSERTSEVVLLSSNAEKKSDGKCNEVLSGEDCGRFEHVKGCKHIQSRNIMLIEWDGKIAYRRGLGTIDLKDWEDVKTEIKTIVLG